MNRSTGAYSSESAWSGGGGGMSGYISQPTYQNGVVTQTSTKRGTPDVAFLADPNTGVAVYDSINGGATAPWIQVGGTSLAAPMMAATVALANQARVANGMGTLNGRTETLPKIYALAQGDFHDITTGNNGGFSAGAGYDLVTGRGTPIANKFVPDLAGVATTLAAPSAPDLATTSDSGASNTDNITNVNTPTFTGTAPAGSTVALFAGSTPVGATTADASGNYSVASSALADGTYSFTVKASLASASSTSSGMNVTIDTVAPTGSTPSFRYETGQSLSYTFSESLATNPGSSDLTLLNTTTGATISTSASYDAAGRTVTYTFPAGILPNGSYQPTLGAGINDVAGNAMAASGTSIDSPAGFFFLDGDANRDGVVNALDFSILATNFGTSSATFSSGDFNYDHTVNAMDFAALSVNFGARVATTPAVPTATPTTTAVPVTSSVFSSSKITDSVLSDVL